jgi:hypothetical protein
LQLPGCDLHSEDSDILEQDESDSLVIGATNHVALLTPLYSVFSTA